MNTNEFLSAILPTEGNYFLALPNKNKGYKHLPFTDIDEMSRMALACSNRGVNVFFACSSFEYPSYTITDIDGNTKTKYRTGENALYVKSQWLDLDGDQKQNLIDLIQFCKETKIPQPNIKVNSGNGIHVYWLFTENVLKEHWLTAAKLFKAICAQYKLGQEDTSRTADVSSVLRPVGTNNDKTAKGLGIKPVKILGTVNPEPIPFVTWVKHLKRLKKELGIEAPKVFKPANNINDDLCGGTEYKPAYSNIIADQCKQIGHFRDTKGVDQPEPLWWQCLGVLKHAVDGQEHIHEWSSGHKSYSHSETQTKIDNWGSGPATCVSFHDRNPELCNGCKHFGNIRSPIQLGEADPEPLTEVEYETKEGEVKKDPVPTLPERFKGEFQHGKGGLECNVETEGVKRWTLISEAVPRVTEYYKDTEDGTYKAIVQAYIKPGVYNEAKIDVKAIGQGGITLAGALAANLCVTTVPGKQRYMDKYMHTWIEEIRRESEETAMHTHMGWYEDGSFLLGDRKYMPNGEVKKVMLKSAIRRLADTMVPTGNLERYKELIDTVYNRPKHEPYQFTWLAGFGSVLLNIMHPEPIGIVFDGWSSESGLGKSTVAKLATGIWMKSDIVDANGTTEYALTYKSGMYKNLPIILDETTQWDGEKLGKFAYRYGSGKAKEQGKADGGLRDNSDVNWCNFLFATSNKRMSDLISTAHSNAAPQIARLWEYEFTAKHKDMLSEERSFDVLAELFTIYGVAGEVFLPYVVQNRAHIAEQLSKTRATLMKAAGLQHDARFWVMGAAAVIVAATIAKKLELHRFDEKALAKWILARLSGMSNTSREAVKDVAALFGDMMADLQGGFIVTNITGDRRTEVASYAPGYGPPRGAITGRAVVNESVVYVSTSALREWCKDHDVSARDMLDIIKMKGWYKGEHTFRLGTGTLIALPPTSVVKLDWKAFSSNISLVKTTNFEDTEEMICQQ